MLNQIKQSVDYIRGITNQQYEIGIILGTGLGDFVRDIDIKHSIDYRDIPGFMSSTVQGHEGKLLFGIIEGKSIIAMQGRFHYYEGYSMKDITFPVRIMKQLGINKLLVSNASGGLNHDFAVGDLMIIKDHINLFPDNPLRGLNSESYGSRFPDMSDCYSEKLVFLAEEICIKLNIPVKKGIYVGLQGPSLETPAEYTMLRNMGADAVGMSTIPEIIVARQLEISCFAISVISNLGVPGKIKKTSIEDVIVEAKKAEENLSQIFKNLIKDI